MQRPKQLTSGLFCICCLRRLPGAASIKQREGVDPTIQALDPGEHGFNGVGCAQVALRDLTGELSSAQKGWVTNLQTPSTQSKAPMRRSSASAFRSTFLTFNDGVLGKSSR